MRGSNAVRHAAVHAQMLVLKMDELLCPLLMVNQIQLLGYYATGKDGLGVDQPRNLMKSISME